MTIDREPLYDLDGVLLGHSCRALIPESYFMKEVTVERKRRLQEEIGLDKKVVGQPRYTRNGNTPVSLSGFNLCKEIR